MRRHSVPKPRNRTAFTRRVEAARHGGPDIKNDKDKPAPRDDSAKVSSELDPKDLDQVVGGTIKITTPPHKGGDPEDGGN
jgi:hypothetical protein